MKKYILISFISALAFTQDAQPTVYQQETQANLSAEAFLSSREEAQVEITLGFDGLYTPHEFGNIKHHNMDIYSSGLMSNFQFRRKFSLIWHVENLF